jgi:NAD(P)-dependent dehydrogenase (short-subunit alcohol dehydrogenase family)
MSGFTTADIPHLSGQTAIVTGASSGIGLETAKALAARGARVILAVRDLDRGRRAAVQVQGHGAGPGETEVRLLDLASLESVRAFAAGWSGPVDLLINNAGVMIPPLSRTADGFELQFGTNHLGHFALTNLLLPSIGGRGRVVTVSSDAHKGGSIDFDDLNWERKRYRAWRAYSQSKLANLLFTAELQRRLTEAGSTVLSVAAHPGYAATNLQSGSGSAITRFAMEKLGNRLLAQDARGGALPTLYVATAAVPGNTFAGPSGFAGLRGAPAPCSRSKAASDPETARRLWDASEQMTGIRFPDIQSRLRSGNRLDALGSAALSAQSIALRLYVYACQISGDRAPTSLASVPVPGCGFYGHL